MKTNSFSGVSLFLFSCFFTATLFATLGESENSIEKERLSLSEPTVQRETYDTYTVHQLKGKDLTIREYSIPEGKIFAISWFGGVANLKTLLVGYFDEYEEARNRAPKLKGSRRLLVRSKSLIVEHAGSIRNLRGRAYLPELLPKGFHESIIR